jgi:hypothetical protein
VQAQTSNHGKRRRLRVGVVSVAGKGGAELRQVGITKTNASEPLMTCRKTVTDVETGIETLSRESGGEGPVYGSTGIRHEGGVSVIQAWVRNVGTCRSDAKGAAQAGSPRKRLSTEAGHRGGVARRRAERAVNGTGPKGRRRPALSGGQLARGGLAWIRPNRFVLPNVRCGKRTNG